MTNKKRESKKNREKKEERVKEKEREKERARKRERKKKKTGEKKEKRKTVRKIIPELKALLLSAWQLILTNYSLRILEMAHVSSLRHSKCHVYTCLWCTGLVVHIDWMHVPL